ncbi:SPOSA6832_02056, partial [Sporobolomyces salmonicolor]
MHDQDIELDHSLRTGSAGIGAEAATLCGTARRGGSAAVGVTTGGMSLLDVEIDSKRQQAVDSVDLASPGVEMSLFELEARMDKGGEEGDDRLAAAGRGEGEVGKVSEEEKREQLPKGIRLVLLMLAMLLVETLVGLDNTIVASSTVTIANDFHALTDVGWYGSAYLLTCCSFQPLFGRAYHFFPQKWVFLFAFCVFELGSLVAALATSSAMLIAGRAIQGLGYAVLAISANSLPIRMQALMTHRVCSGFGTVVGPLIGGVLTSKLSWRWCFWVNLLPSPFVFVIIFFFCNPPRIPQTLSVRERLVRMDWVGAFLLLGATVCLLLALQEGGITTPWRSSKIIGLLVGFCVIFLAFLALQAYLGEKSSISMRLLRTRNMAAASFVNFASGSSYYSMLYYIPIFFQTVEGSSPIRSGIQMLPLIFLNMAAGIVVGWVCSHYGTFHWCMLAGTTFSSLGAGLLASMDENTTMGQWVGYQMIAGAGMGALYMMSFIASQILLPPSDRSKAASLVCFVQIFSATAWVSASGALYQNSFKNGLMSVPGLDVQQVLDSGVSSFRNVVAPDQLLPVTKIADRALFKVFLAVAVVAAVGFVAVFAVEWKGIGKRGGDGEKES